MHVLFEAFLCLSDTGSHYFQGGSTFLQNGCHFKKERKNFNKCCFMDQSLPLNCRITLVMYSYNDIQKAPNFEIIS